MQSLISIGQSVIDGLSVQTVNARDLHGFLESKQQFSNWIQSRIEQYNFKQDIDFAVIHDFVNDATAFGGKRKIIDYIISIDMAKVLAAVERNEKGRSFLAHMVPNSIASADDLFALLSDVDVPESPDLFVYAIQEVETGKIKIGISKNPHQRLKQLQTANPNTLQIVAIKDAPNRFSDELALHADLATHRIRGEWFDGRAMEALGAL